MFKKLFSGVKYTKTGYKNRKRVLLIFSLIAFLFALLALRVGWHMIIKGDEYSQKASKQQTIDRVVSAVRGDILDASGNQIAISATTHTIWVRPGTVKSNGKTDTEVELNAREEAKQLAEILGLDEESVYETITADKTLIKVAKYVDSEKTEAVRAAKLSGIEIVQDVRRYYPLGSFACQTLGLTNDDGEGMTGLEKYYDRYLSGINGRWITSKDNRRNSLVYGDSKYYNAQDGYTLVTTIDQNIQYIVEENIVTHMQRVNADRISVLVMDPNNGAILAMAQSDEFDPNDPRAPQPGDEERFASLTDEEKVAYWNRVWRSFCMSDVYEPGSTFKLVTTSIALDAGVTHMGDTFNCYGFLDVYDRRLKCWNYPYAHGTETLEQAVANSCNVTMMHLVARMGKETFYQGLENFGLLDKTGVDFPGEGRNIIYSRTSMGPVEMSTMSYGQGISLTPVSLCTAISAIANGGDLLQPRLVSEIRDADGNVVEKFDKIIRGKAISEQTSADMRVIMEGAGGNARISGYRIGGKTGTADKPSAQGGYTGVYASFVGVAPIDDPKMVVLVLADNPRSADIHGGTVAAPIAKEIMEDTLKYLNIAPEYTEEELARINSKLVTVPNLSGAGLENLDSKVGNYLKYELSPALEEGRHVELVVTDQYPKPGNRVDKGSTITVYYEVTDVEEEIIDPE